MWFCINLYSGESYLLGKIQTERNFEDSTEEAMLNVSILVHSKVLVSLEYVFCIFILKVLEMDQCKLGFSGLSKFIVHCAIFCILPNLACRVLMILFYMDVIVWKEGN